MAKAYNSIGWENGTKEQEAYVTIGGVDYEVTPAQWDGNTPVDATNLDHMEKGIENSFDVKIIAYTDTAPSECATGDIYYNTTNKLLYKATGTNTWGANGSEPLEGILYILFDSENETGKSYSWNGSDLISVGGGGGSDDEVIISDEEPTTNDWKLWIDSGQTNNLGSEVVDNLNGNETNLAPSVRAVKDLFKSYELTLDTAHSANQYTCVRIGNVVTISGQLYTISTTANTSNIIGSVPDEIKPSVNARGTMILMNGGTGATLGYGMFGVYTNGELRMIPNISASSSDSPIYIVSLTYTI